MAGKVRIKGVVGAYRQWRERIAAGVAPEEEPTLRRHILDEVREFRRLCAEAGGRLEELPAPTQVALRGLEELAESTSWPSGQGGPEQRTVPVRNVVRLVSERATELWEHAPRLCRSKVLRARAHRAVVRLVRDIERVLTREGATPAQLPAPSRRAFATVKVIADEARFLEHVASLSEIQQALPDKLREEAFASLCVQRALWRRRSPPLRLKFHQAFIGAPRPVWESLVAEATGDTAPQHNARVRAYTETHDFRALVAELAELCAEAPAPRGVAHDLDASFERVNSSFFDQRLHRPTLRWGDTPTIRKFGHYDFHRDLVEISASLDSASVPEWVVDYVMFHELLHKVHGCTNSGARRRFHTVAFAADEHAFPRYQEAEAYLSQLAGRLRRGSDPGPGIR